MAVPPRPGSSGRPRRAPGNHQSKWPGQHASHGQPETPKHFKLPVTVAVAARLRAEAECLDGRDQGGGLGVIVMPGPVTEPKSPAPDSYYGSRRTHIQVRAGPGRRARPGERPAVRPRASA